MPSAPKLKPGQKHPTPTPGFGDRVFYETLLNQRPDSAMAQEWCVAFGVLSHKKAARLYEEIMERKTGKKRSVSSPSPVRKKKIKTEEDADERVVL